MNVRANESPETKGQRVGNNTSQGRSAEGLAFQVVDNRPSAIAQRKLQAMANDSLQAVNLRAIQKMASAASSPIQRFVGADGTNQENAVIPFTLDQEFNDKHVAEDEDGAIANTQARIDDPNDTGGGMIREGHIGNTVAMDETWTAAINGNTDKVPEAFIGPDEEEKNAEGFNAADYDDNGYYGNSSYMMVNGWDVRLNQQGDLVATQAGMNRRVGGTYRVVNLDASIAINHCTQ